MERSTAILLVLGVYLVGMLLIGWSARRASTDAATFYLGGRRLGPWVAALAANASSSSAWSLLGVCGFAYAQGFAAVWLLPGCIGGFALNWLLVAPAVRARTGAAVTMTELLAGPRGRPGRTAFVWFATLLTLASLLTYVSAQMQAAGAAMEHTFELPQWQGIVIGATLTIAYTLLGGYLAASRTDTIQGLMMVGVAVVVPAVGLWHVGGLGALLDAVDQVQGSYEDPFAGLDGAAAAAFALALCGIALGYPGQPHAINKYMGMADGASMTTARVVGIGWALVLYPGMIVLGWIAKVAFPPLPEGEHEQALFLASQQLLPPVVDGLVLVAVLAAVMSTVDGQLLVCGSSASHDLRRSPGSGHTVAARLTVFAIAVGATLAAVLVPETIFERVMFAWATLGSAFGPLLLVTVLARPVAAPWALASAATGGGLAVLTYYLPVLADGFGDRVLAWVAALIVALVGSRPAARAAT